MEQENHELTPDLIIKHAKKHPHNYNISSQAFSVAGKDIVIYNISLKSDPETEFDITNFRRGLTLLEQIIDYKQGPIRVAKKGHRKFFDMIPEYLSAKNTHISSSKFHIHRKQVIFSQISHVEAENYIIYSTQKANGQNVQISWDNDGGFWVIGSKNKTLLLAEQKDLKYIKHKHEHVRTTAIAEMWFGILEKIPQHIQIIKKYLSKYTLIGEHCDTVKSGHIVDYGKQRKIMFYSLVQKNGLDYTCQSPQKLLDFLDEVSLKDYCVKFQINQAKTYEALIQQLRKQVFRINQAPMSQQGQGRVIYITAKTKVSQQTLQQQCLSIFKLKTLQYRIYRKLRQKIRIYFQKMRKTYDKLLNKYIQEVKELAKGFELPQPEEYYFDIGKKAFYLCDDQGKSVSKFVHNRFVSFLKILQSNQISKEQFLTIVNDSSDNQLNKFLNQGQIKIQGKQQSNKNQQALQKQKEQKKKLIILIPLTIPSSGKSSIFRKIKQNSKQIKVQILSSDTVRFQVMTEKMKRQKSMNKRTAYEKSRKEATERFYKYMGNIIKNIAKDKEQYKQYVFFVDKNHPQNALKTTIQELKNKLSLYNQELDYRIIGLFPKCEKLLQDKPKFMYPFSSNYVLACCKRVLQRQEHQTLEGTQNQRVNVCISFANMFRNFSLSKYHIQKYFNFAIKLSLTNETNQQNRKKADQLGLEQTLTKILMGKKPGSFDEHKQTFDLVQRIKKWDYIQQDIQKTANQCIQQLIRTFKQGWEPQQTQEMINQIQE